MRMQSALYQKWDKRLNQLLAKLEGICTLEVASNVPAKNVRTIAMQYMVLIKENGTIELGYMTQEVKKYPAQEEHDSMADLFKTRLAKELELLQLSVAWQEADKKEKEH